MMTVTARLALFIFQMGGQTTQVVNEILMREEFAKMNKQALSHFHLVHK